MKKTRFQRFFYRTKNATVHHLGKPMSVQDTLLNYYCLQPSLHRTQPVVSAKMWRLASMVFLLLYSTSFIRRPERYLCSDSKMAQQRGPPSSYAVLCRPNGSSSRSIRTVTTTTGLLLVLLMFSLYLSDT